MWAMAFGARPCAYGFDKGRRAMDRLPNVADLTAGELASLTLVCRGFVLRTIPRAHEARLVELGLIQQMMGGLVITPSGRMVARA